MKPVGKHDRAHRGLITSKEEREGIYFHDSLRELNNLADIIQVYIMPNMSSHGIVNLT